MRQALGVVDVLVAGEAAEHGLAQQPGQRLAGVRAAEAFRQNAAGQIGQPQRIASCWKADTISLLRASTMPAIRGIRVIAPALIVLTDPVAGLRRMSLGWWQRVELMRAGCRREWCGNGRVEASPAR